MNPMFKTDSYKFSHKDMFVPNTNLVYSHVTPRNNKYLKEMYPDIPDTVIVFGLQYVVRSLKKDWDDNFFAKPWPEIEKEAFSTLGPHLGKPDAYFLDNFKQLHELGYLPIRIKGIPELTEVPLNVPIATIQNTHPDFYWFTNNLESVILGQIYTPLTVATIGRLISKLRDKYFDMSCEDNDPFRDFALHDFSFRGHTSWESALQASIAFSLYTKGTDTVVGLKGMVEYYDAKETCYSLSATEHSLTGQGILHYAELGIKLLYETASSINEGAIAKYVIMYPEFTINHILTLYSLVQQLDTERLDLNETELLLGELVNLYRLLVIKYPTGMLAYVSDTFNYYALVNKILPVLKDIIISRDGKLIIRPDSYDPEIIVLGHDKTVNQLVSALPINSFYRINDHTYIKSETGSHELVANEKIIDIGYEQKGTIKALEEIFGTTVNSKGYKELPPQIGIVYGDGINYERMGSIYKRLTERGYAVNCICMAAGAYMLSGSITRDSLSLVVKASQTRIGDKLQPVYKDPITDQGKTSPSGFLKVTEIPGKIMYIPNVSEEQETTGMLQVILEDGELYNQVSYDNLRNKAKEL